MKKRLLIGCIATMSVVLAVYGQTAGQQSSNSSAASVSAQRAVIDRYCISCHNQKTPNGIAMDQLDLARVGADAEPWEKVVHKIRAGMMPPSGKPRPDHATLEALAVWLENELDRNPVAQSPPPGLHRLNRTEYTNAIRDLLALEVDAAKFLPPDDSTRGFDNMAAALGLSPALLEAYLSAAGKISRLANGDVKAPTQVLYRLPEDNTQNYHVEGLPFGTRGGILIRNTAANPKTRFIAIFIPHGMAPGWWVPKTEGTGFEFPFIMEPLGPFRDRVVILSGLHARSAEPPPGVTGSDHFVAAAYLCANKPKKTTGADINVGTETIDQMIAQKIGQDTLLPSLQLAVEDPGASSSCGEGYHCAYTNSISWSAANKPLPMELNPQVVFERLFGDGSSPQERTARRLQQGSILDMVTGSLARLRKDVGPSDRARLDQYAEDIREIERRLELASQASADAPSIAVPTGVPESFDEHIKLHFDLNALAFQGDITRVSTLLGARDLTNRSFPASGTNTGFHGGSHHAENPDRIADYAKINRYHVQKLAHFLEKLQSTPDGDGALLDHSLILYGTNMGNSNQHQHYDVPHILAGGASGQLKGGRHLAYPPKTVPTGNLLLSILDMFGFHEDSVGDSTGRLEKL